MNKKVYNTILLFTGFVLTGIISLQIVWLNNMADVRKKELVSYTQQALTSTVNKLEKDEEAEMVWKNLDRFAPDSINIGNLGTLRIVVNADDSIETINITNSYMKGVVINDKRDSRHHELITHKRTVSISSDDSTKKRLEVKMKNIDSVVQQMVIEMDEMEPIERIPVNIIHSLLTEELKKMGIGISFEYAVLQNDSIIHQSKDYIPSSLAMTFDAKLFPHDIFDNNLKLVMYYPVASSNGYLFSKMKTTLWLTGLFSLSILIAFYLTIRTIKKHKKLSEMKNDFINNITHEFKTPIATSTIAIAALENDQVRSDITKFNYYTRVLKEENNKMNQHVEKVLQLAMMDKGKLDVMLAELNGHEVLTSSYSGFNLLFKEYGITTSIQLNASHFNIKSDPFHLLHVFNNIIDNAIKYRSASPSLVITTENLNNQWIVKFKDNGIGMSNEVLKHAFNTFYRGQKGDLHEVKGFGLGLSYAKNIVELSKGTIHINSAPGKGTEVMISLPLV